MRVIRLKLANVRAVKAAEFEFRPGFNLVAGVNGVGKTTILDALAVCISAVARHASHWPKFGKRFGADDIRFGVNALQAECSMECGGQNIRYALHRFRDRTPLQPAEKWSRANRDTCNDPAFEEFHAGFPTDGAGGKPEGAFLTVNFSTGRSVACHRSSRSGGGGGGGGPPPPHSPRPS